MKELMTSEEIDELQSKLQKELEVIEPLRPVLELASELDDDVNVYLEAFERSIRCIQILGEISRTCHETADTMDACQLTTAQYGALGKLIQCGAKTVDIIESLKEIMDKKEKIILNRYIV